MGHHASSDVTCDKRSKLFVRWDYRVTYKDDSVKGQVTGIGELLADGTVSEELVLDRGGLDSSIQVLNGLA